LMCWKSKKKMANAKKEKESFRHQGGGGTRGGVREARGRKKGGNLNREKEKGWGLYRGVCVLLGAWTGVLFG